LKHSTRQRFVTIEFTYPPADKEVEIIAHEAGVEQDIAHQLAVLGEKVRHLKASGLEEGVSTRLLIYAGELIRQGMHHGARRRSRSPGRSPTSGQQARDRRSSQSDLSISCGKIREAAR